MVKRVDITGLLVTPDLNVEVRATEVEDGNFIFYDDYQRLEAENEQLREAYKDAIEHTVVLREALEKVVSHTDMDYVTPLNRVIAIRLLIKQALEQSDEMQE
jgi:hypothetical protein